MAWPLSQDYNEALQNPHSSFSDPDLRQGQVSLNALGIPLPCSGNFADVYAVECPATRSKWAVKCFTREVRGLRERYSEISKHLQKAHLPFAVEFQYLEQGIRIAGKWYPVLKMHWVEGKTLNAFVRDMLDKPAKLDVMSQIWLRMAQRLREADIAHCDLQHGNVLMVFDSASNAYAVKLIDYDGMWVPSLAQTPSGEIGHPAYQHPQRLRDSTYRPEVDNFSLLAVYGALRALVVGGRALWQRYDTGDNLLFRQQDFEAPTRSPLFAEMLRMKQPDVRDLAVKIIDAARTPLEKVPHLTEFFPSKNGSSIARRDSIAPSASAASVSRQERENAPIIKPPTSGKRGSKSRTWMILTASAAVIAILVGGLLWTIRKKDRAENASIPPEQKSNPGVVKPNSHAPTTAPNSAKNKESTTLREIAIAPPSQTAALSVDGKPRWLKDFAGHSSSITCVAFAPDGRRFLSASADGSVRLWDAVTGKELWRKESPKYVVWSVAFSSDGKYAVSAGNDRVIRLWDVETGKSIREIPGHTGSVRRAVFFPDGKSVVSTGLDRSVRRWDVRTGSQIRQYNKRVEYDDYWLALSPKGDLIYSGGEDPFVRGWDAESGEEQESFILGNGFVHAIDCSPDSQFIAVGGSDTVVRIWRTSAHTLVHNLKKHTAKVNAVCFSPDSRQLLSASSDGTVRLWDVKEGRSLCLFRTDTNTKMTTVAFAPNGRHFLTGGEDKLVNLWLTPSPDLLPRQTERAPKAAAPPKPPDSLPRPTEPSPKVAAVPKPPKNAKLPVPDKDARDKLSKEIHGFYQSDFKHLLPAERLTLAKKLFQRGQNAEEEADRRFAFLREARDAAADAADVALCLRIVAEMSKTFAIDEWAMKTEVFSRTAKATRKIETLQEILGNTLVLLGEAEAADKYESALPLAKLAGKIAQKAGDPGLENALKQRVIRLNGLQKAHEKIANETAALAAKPRDPHASRVVGVFRCLDKGDWKRGLPLLAQGDDLELAKLAREEINEPTEANERAKLGHSWWKFADTQKGQHLKAARRRARHWLYLALPLLQGSERVRADDKLSIKKGRLTFRPGLVAELFADDNLKNRVKTRFDYTIRFNWKFQAPDTGVPTDHFSIRWQGWLIPPRAGKYKLRLLHDDGARLRLDGNKIIDNWGNVGDESVEVVLSAQPHALLVELREFRGLARIDFTWSQAGFFKEQTIPIEVLFHDQALEKLLSK